MKSACMVLAIFVSGAATASVPLSWEVKPGHASPVAFDRFHGESLHLSAEFVGFSEPPFASGADVRLWYQTNGMGSAWWSVPASVESNRVSAVWSPELDPGAERVTLFFGAPSNAYCSAVLRLRGSPGMVPNALPLPVQRLDYAAIEVANAPYYTKSEADAKIVELAPAPGNYAAVSNAAMSAYVDATNTVLTHVQHNYLPRSWSGFGYSWQLDPIEDSIYFERRFGEEGPTRARYGIDSLQLEGDSSAGISTFDWIGFWIGEKEISEGSRATFYGDGFIAHADGSGVYEYTFPKPTEAFGTFALISDVTSAAANAYSSATNNAAQTYVKKAGDTITGTLTFKGSGIGSPSTTVNNSGISTRSVTLSGGFGFFQSADMDSGGVTVASEYADSDSGSERFTYPLGSGGGTFALAQDVVAATNGLPSWAKASSKPSYSWSEITSKPTFATVATSGSYNDLSNKPTIPDISGKADKSALAQAATAATNYTDAAIAAIPEPDLSGYAAASDVAANSADIADLRVESSLVYRLYSGSNVVCEVTNYNSAVRSPTMRLLQLDTNGVYTVVWTETNNLHRVAQAATNYTDAAISAATNRFAPRAWSGVTSGLGVDAPPDTTWISTPTTVLAGGFEYQKAVTSAGTVWVLTSNGMTTLGPSANGSYLDIAAADGTSVFRIEKTDSYLVGAAADGITVSGNTVTISVPVVAGDHPYLRYAASLESPVTWYKEEESDIPGTVSYSWSGSSGAWVCTVTTANPSGFFYFEFMQQGSTKIVNNGVTDLSGGIWFNGVKYMPHVSGTKLEFVAE